MITNCWACGRRGDFKESRPNTWPGVGTEVTEFAHQDLTGAAKRGEFSHSIFSVGSKCLESKAESFQIVHCRL